MNSADRERERIRCFRWDEWLLASRVAQMNVPIPQLAASAGRSW